MTNLILLSLVGVITLSAQGPDLRTLHGGAQALHDQTKGAILAAAEKMKADDYGFSPVNTVRTFGQLVGHLADAQYLFCSAASGVTNPAPGIEKTKTSKEDLVADLKEAIAYCDKVYAATNEANVSQVVKLFGSERTRLNVLSFNTMHSYEHYGNMVTYMRMRGAVPPTSTRN